MVRNANISDINSIVAIHFSELNSDFLPSLGIKFLSLLHFSFFNNKNTYVGVASSHDNIQGFIVGSCDFNSAFKEIICKDFIKYIFILLPHVIKRPILLKFFLDTLLYSQKTNDKIKTELVIIAISKKYHRKGIGKHLVFALEKYLLNKRIKEYKVSVNSNNLSANMFYASLNFKKVYDFSL